VRAYGGLEPPPPKVRWSHIKMNVGTNLKSYLQNPYSNLDIGEAEINIAEPPSDDSHITRMELEELGEIVQEAKLPREIMRVADRDPLRLFYSVAKKKGLDPLEEEAKRWADDWTKLSFEFKLKFKRRRPYEVKKEHDINFVVNKSDTTESPSYPSGHAMMGYGVAEFYKSKYPLMADEWDNIADIIAHSRLQMGVHYPSDVRASKQVVEQLSDQVKVAELSKESKAFLKKLVNTARTSSPALMAVEQGGRAAVRRGTQVAKDTASAVNQGARRAANQSIEVAKRTGNAARRGATAGANKARAAYYHPDAIQLSQKAQGAVNTLSEEVLSKISGVAESNHAALSRVRDMLQKTSAYKDYRPRGTLYLLDGKGGVMADKPTADYNSTTPYFFPGGGIFEEEKVDRLPTRDEIVEGVEREALEELGTKLKNVRVLQDEPANVDMPNWWRERQKKKRGVDYKGIAEFFAAAERGGLDKSIYGADNDEFKGTFYPIDEVASALEANAKPGDDYYEDSMRQARLLRSLLEKTSAAQPLLRHRSTLLIRDPKTNKLLAAKAPPESKASPFYFPGGGLYEDEYATPRNPSDEDIIEGARREALEELGIELDNPRVVGSHAQELEDWWKEKALKNRGVPYVGGHEHYVLADRGKDDRSLYNIEGDAFEQGDYYDPKEIVEALSRVAKGDSTFAPFNREQVRAIKDNLLRKNASDLSVLTAVPTQNLDLIMRKGLYSQKAMLDDPEVMAAFLAQRNADKAWKNDEQYDEKRFREQYDKRLKLLEGRDGALAGPSVFFTEPDPDIVSDPRHLVNKFNTQTLRVNLAKLLKDIPETRIQGAELTPFLPEHHTISDEEWEEVLKQRERDLSSEEVAKYVSTDPKELWKHYPETAMGKQYAVNVPHAFIRTPSGIIPPEYLEQVEKTSSDNTRVRRPRVSVFMPDGKGNIFTQNHQRGFYKFPGGGVFLDDKARDRMPTDEEVLEAANQEALEELGYSLRNSRIVGDPRVVDIDDPEWQKNIKDKSGQPYTGISEHYVVAEPGEEDRSVYNIHGDAFTGDYVPIKEVIEDLEKYKGPLASTWGYPNPNASQIEVLKSLLEKTSSQRLRTTIFGVDPEGKLLHGFGNQGFYKFPGGGVDPGESIVDAAKRELLEEAGYDVESIEELPGLDTSDSVGASSAKGHMGHGSSLTKYLLARLGKRNESLLGSEGDAIGNLQTAPIDEVLGGLEGDMLFGSGVAESNHAALSRVRDMLQKTSSAKEQLKHILIKKAALEDEFQPDLTPDDLKALGVYDQVYGDAPSEASMKEWPEHWINKQDPLGWLQWYDRYSEGRRTDDDERQMKRWKSFKARHLAQYLKKPTPRRAAALRNWGIDVEKY
jgi:8-oxo-dGTP pyrophosphatase MutT (NUDIX family)